jgi:hypothetical protein
MHRDAVVSLADASHEPLNSKVGVVYSGVVEGEDGVLAAAPQKGRPTGRCAWNGFSGLAGRTAGCQPGTPTAALSRGGPCVNQVRQRSDCDRGGPVGIFTRFPAGTCRKKLSLPRSIENGNRFRA